MTFYYCLISFRHFKPKNFVSKNPNLIWFNGSKKIAEKFKFLNDFIPTYYPESVNYLLGILQYHT